MHGRSCATGSSGASGRSSAAGGRVASAAAGPAGQTTRPPSSPLPACPVTVKRAPLSTPSSRQTPPWPCSKTYSISLPSNGFVPCRLKTYWLAASLHPLSHDMTQGSNSDLDEQHFERGSYVDKDLSFSPDVPRCTTYEGQTAEKKTFAVPKSRADDWQLRAGPNLFSWDKCDDDDELKIVNKNCPLVEAKSSFETV